MGLYRGILFRYVVYSLGPKCSHKITVRHKYIITVYLHLDTATLGGWLGLGFKDLRADVRFSERCWSK